MSYKDKTDLTADEARDRVWELAEKINICMLVTWDWRTPARATACRECRTSMSNAIYFLTDVNGLKDDQIEHFPIVTLAFADTGGIQIRQHHRRRDGHQRSRQDQGPLDAGQQGVLGFRE